MRSPNIWLWKLTTQTRMRAPATNLHRINEG
jgi:hypothetical protein